MLSLRGGWRSGWAPLEAWVAASANTKLLKTTPRNNGENADGWRIRSAYSIRKQTNQQAPTVSEQSRKYSACWKRPVTRPSTSGAFVWRDEPSKGSQYVSIKAFWFLT
ncbi:unnamed protein product [Heligmosomoides polygyrus]|uniref:Secreted protein n=1 Tax=Heligmosomoides polygyrus TaxID=6339 RepID=A0A183GLF8_HELPZ|nr:unnamed protein product [Heligmosomoides polygyrus]